MYKYFIMFLISFIFCKFYASGDYPGTAGNISTSQLSAKNIARYIFLQTVKHGSTPAVKLLLKMGANPNQIINGTTPLLEAVKKQQVSKVQALVNAQADVHLYSSYGDNPVNTALQIAHEALLKQETLINIIKDYNSINTYAPWNKKNYTNFNCLDRKVEISFAISTLLTNHTRLAYKLAALSLRYPKDTKRPRLPREIICYIFSYIIFTKPNM